MRFALLSVLFCVATAACGGNDEEEAYPTYQECFDDHHTNESLSVHDSIVVCCLEHPINGVKEVCGATAADCTAYLGTNLSATSATSTDVMTACTDYVTQKGM
jgi:hypothetical protein